MTDIMENMIGTVIANEQASDPTNVIIYPRRLVFIQVANNCMFCENPQGEALTHFVNRDHNMGYISCNDCYDKATDAVNYWEKHLMFGRALYLKDRDILVKRTSGDIEPGWTITNPFILTDYMGIEKIQCCNKKLHIERWCLVDEILELNPQ